MAEFKILCTNHEVCDDVIDKLNNLGFIEIKHSKEPSFDIIAKYPVNLTKSFENLAGDIFEKCKGKIQTIQII